MRTATLGVLEVSVVGVGCNNMGRVLDQQGSIDVVRAALDAGMTFFDTSDNYGSGLSEAFLGRALGHHRHRVVIATKFGMPVPGREGTGGARPDYVRRAVTSSLERLCTDYIDLYQLHRPDPDTPIVDTLGAMWDLIDEGLVREIGCSNLNASQLSEAMRATGDGRPLVSNQVEYSLLYPGPQQDGLTDVAREQGVRLLPYYPLACGLLTGKVTRDAEPVGRLSMDRYARFLTDENYRTVGRLRAYADARGLSMVQVALGWLLAQPEVPAVTPGATKPVQVAGNAAAAAWTPKSVDLAELAEVMAA